MVSSSKLLMLVASLMSLVLEATTEMARADGIADGEREFVQQLQLRQFFDLAEQFCERQSESSRTSDERAVWQMMLADCREQHAWVLREPGRTQILTHAAECITAFVRKESPAAEADLLLRVRQVELLSVIAGIDATCAEFGPRTAPLPLAKQAITEGLQLAEAMLEQIDQMRKVIESSVAKAARDRTRQVVAELLLLNARQNPANTALRTQATTAAEQLMKSSNDNDIRFRGRALVAESLLDSKDFRGFDLAVTSMTSSAESPTRQIDAAALKIRGLLKRDQPSEALQLCLDLEKNMLRSDEISTLRLASLLNMFELLSRLDSPELTQKTAEEFRLLSRRLNPSIKGVWRDCCERIAVRFSHVEKFGPDAATAIESVTDLIAAGDLAAARKALLEMRPTFERTKPQIAATLSMQAGDLAIRMQDWPAAEADLTSAVAMFSTTKDREQEAVADLLRVFATGRHWDAESSRTADVRDTLETSYLTALEQHITNYADSVTTSKAREWRALLIRDKDPLAAADDLIALADDTRDDHLSLLVQAGEILAETMSRPLSASRQIDTERMSKVISLWTARTEELLAKQVETETPATPEDWRRPVLEIQRLIFSLQRHWSVDDDWKRLASAVTTHLAGIENASNLNQPETGQISDQHDHLNRAIAEGHAILALAGFRQLLAFDQMQESRGILLQQSHTMRRELAAFLLRQASETSDPIPGDPQLGLLALDLLRDEEFTVMSPDRQLQEVPLWLVASRVADNYQKFDEIITDLTAKSLTDAQLQSTAAILQQRSAIRTTRTNDSESAKSFWQSVLRRSRSGEDQWLEASLQLAAIAVQDQKFQDAERILKVINALHPEWGNPERKSRAASLKSRLESSR